MTTNQQPIKYVTMRESANILNVVPLVLDPPFEISSVKLGNTLPKTIVDQKGDSQTYKETKIQIEDGGKGRSLTVVLPPASSTFGIFKGDKKGEAPKANSQALVTQSGEVKTYDSKAICFTLSYDNPEDLKVIKIIKTIENRILQLIVEGANRYGQTTVHHEAVGTEEANEYINDSKERLISKFLLKSSLRPNDMDKTGRSVSVWFKISQYTKISQAVHAKGPDGEFILDAKGKRIATTKTLTPDQITNKSIRAAVTVNFSGIYSGAIGTSLQCYANGILLLGPPKETPKRDNSAQVAASYADQIEDDDESTNDTSSSPVSTAIEGFKKMSFASTSMIVPPASGLPSVQSPFSIHNTITSVPLPSTGPLTGGMAPNGLPLPAPDKASTFNH